MKKYDQTVEANSISMSYNEFGEGLSPIIFIHGFPFEKNMWQAQMDFLSETLHVISYDVRGFGQSTSEVIRTASIELFAEDLIAFMDALHIETAIVCGFSMGGYILLNAAKRFPDRFSAIILADTQCLADTPDAQQKRHELRAEIEQNGLKKFADDFTKKLFCDASLKYKKPLVKTVKEGILAASPAPIIATLNALANRSETCSSLNQISVPTLIICGNNDAITPLEKSIFMHENIPNSILKTIEKAGHLSNLEQPDKFNKIVYDFIENLPHLSTIKLYGNESLVIEPGLENNSLAFGLN